MWDKGVESSYERFVSLFHRVFKHGSKRKEGTGASLNHGILCGICPEFQTLLAEGGWIEPSLKAEFLQGLNADVLMELAPLVPLLMSPCTSVILTYLPSNACTIATMASLTTMDIMIISSHKQGASSLCRTTKGVYSNSDTLAGSSTSFLPVHLLILKP